MPTFAQLALERARKRQGDWLAELGEVCESHDTLLETLRALVDAHDEEPPILTEAEWQAARVAIASAPEL